MVATGVELFFIAQKRVFVNSVLSRGADFVLITYQNVSESSVVKGTDLSSTGGHTYCLSVRDGNKV